MENTDFMITFCERKSLSNGTRIYNSVYGLILIVVCLINYHIQWLPLIVIGILSIIYGLIGKELFKTRNSVTITQNAIIIRESFQRDITINLKNIEHIELYLYELQVHFIDYVKIYDLSWLSSSEHQKLSKKLDIINSALIH